MSKAISYALFGYNKTQHDSCFSHASYLRGLATNLRMNRLLFPEWITVIHTDKATYDAYAKYFEGIQSDKCQIVVCKDAPLCLAMLWRLKPIFERHWDATAQGYTHWKYTHVICRDTDSPATYREVQAVQQWIDNDKAAHAITDSVSHVIPLMGGMIGFRPAYITERLATSDWDELTRRSAGIDFNNKGSDQDFLNREIYPRIAQHGSDSITQHYFSGMSRTFLSDFHTCTCPPPSGHTENCPNNYKINLPDELKESNSICGHIGSSGAYQSAYEKFIRKYRSMFDDLYIAEENYPDIFYWVKDKSLG